MQRKHAKHTGNLAASLALREEDGDPKGESLWKWRTSKQKPAAFRGEQTSHSMPSHGQAKFLDHGMGVRGEDTYAGNTRLQRQSEREREEQTWQKWDGIADEDEDEDARRKTQDDRERRILQYAVAGAFYRLFFQPVMPVIFYRHLPVDVPCL
jgi:hypothetical protein